MPYLYLNIIILCKYIVPTAAKLTETGKIKMFFTDISLFKSAILISPYVLEEQTQNILHIIRRHIWRERIFFDQAFLLARKAAMNAHARTRAARNSMPCRLSRPVRWGEVGETSEEIYYAQKNTRESIQCKGALTFVGCSGSHRKSTPEQKSI